MSARDGVQDADYDVLRKTGLTRESCWAILECMRNPQAPAPTSEQHEANLRQSGVRVPGVPEPDFLEALELIRELQAQVEELRTANDAGG